MSPRLATLDRKQEAVIVELLKLIAVDERPHGARDDAIAALEEWWLPGARLRAAATAPRTSRADPLPRGRRGCLPLTLSTSLTGGGVHHVRDEHRTIETWGGVLCADVYANVFVNVQPLAHRPWRGRWNRSNAGSRRAPARGWRYPARERRCASRVRRIATVRPSRSARRWCWRSPARAIVALTVRAAERPDVQAELDRVIRSFALVERPSADPSTRSARSG